MQSFYRALNEDGGPSDQVRIIRQGRTIERRLTQ
jgi:hypothetical protein